LRRQPQAFPLVVREKEDIVFIADSTEGSAIRM
jgi:hypothetical protein